MTPYAVPHACGRLSKMERDSRFARLRGRVAICCISVFANRAQIFGVPDGIRIHVARITTGSNKTTIRQAQFGNPGAAPGTTGSKPAALLITPIPIKILLALVQVC